MSLEEKKKKRFELLKVLYDATGGSQFKWLPLADLGNLIGLDREQTMLAGEYLKGEGLLEFKAFGPLVGITHEGIREIEEALEHPDRPTDHFLPLNVINIGSMIGPTIQTAGRNSSQSGKLNDSRPSDLQQLLTEITSAIANPAVPTEAREEVLADVATVETQLRSPKPKGSIISEAKKSIRNVLEGIGAGIIANGIFERLK